MNVQVNGVILYYEKQGSGPPLVLLHGNGEDGRIFDIPQKCWSLITPSTPLTAAATAKAAAMCP